ncbi:Bgt-4266 [Blumeria graminis f. sp. tritici]|uniref:Bgt-4266 n=2 Tax=Blumeria graminis f. sp. tritici TaxID=62690 RepID=A0A061HIW7_BLUGR|nr:hypothetical protein BGT96224_4266 [Blumeria graminis f. sp. tritici 96224]VCU40801.1 Bgt-4266 [Blumeria graminis f. sp. tritici]
MNALCVRSRWGPVRVATELGLLRLCQRSSLFSNFFSTLSDQSRCWTTVRIDCGVSGHIIIDFFNQQLLREDPTAPLVVYLPPTGIRHSKHQPPIPSYLLSSSTVLARINYRWNIPSAYSLGASDNHPFPVPLHDTVRGWSHITERLVSSYQSFELSAEPIAQTSELDASHLPVKTGYPVQRPVFIYGTFLGGTLATSLALTENYVLRENPFRIRGLIAKNAVFDWVSIVTDAFSRSIPRTLPKTPQNSQYTWNESDLIRLRKKLFTKPNRCFDAFASPMLFFRTAGVPPPCNWTESYKSSYPLSSEGERSKNNPSKDEVRSKLPDRLNSRYWFGFEDFDPPKPKFPYKVSNFELAYKRAYLFYPQASPWLEIPSVLILSNNQRIKSNNQDPTEEIKDFQETSMEINTMRQSKIMVNLIKRQSGFKIDNNDQMVNNGDIQMHEIDDDYEAESEAVKQWMETRLK